MNSDVLFKPFNHPKLQLPNRIIMAPMTRQFSPNGIPDILMSKNITEGAPQAVSG